MSRYIVTSPVEHDGKPYGINSEIDLSDTFAAPLLQVGVITVKDSKPKKPVKADEESASE